MQVKGAYLPYVTADAHAVRRQDVPLCAATAKDKIKGTRLTTDTLLVAGAGFEPYDLRVMSPMSYQTALPRDIYSPFQGAVLLYDKIDKLSIKF